MRGPKRLGYRIATRTDLSWLTKFPGRLDWKRGRLQRPAWGTSYGTKTYVFGRYDGRYNRRMLVRARPVHP